MLTGQLICLDECAGMHTYTGVCSYTVCADEAKEEAPLPNVTKEGAPPNVEYFLLTPTETPFDTLRLTVELYSTFT